MSMENNKDAASPNLEQLIQLGIQTAKQGNLQNARMIFQQVLDEDKKNERAWLLMARVAENRVDRQRYIQTVLNINPNNADAQRLWRAEQKKRQSSNSQVLVYGGIALSIVLILIAVALLALFVL
ncbi:MAG: tetratricopeptide repeat protein [Anaerolineae bacterium]|nr:tetratricopeptide repeat protein [Anaerolineae bacterium]